MNNSCNVLVLIIEQNGETFPEVHTTLDGAIESAVSDIMEHKREGCNYDFEQIRRELKDDFWYNDEHTGTTYELCERELVR